MWYSSYPDISTFDLLYVDELHFEMKCAVARNSGYLLRAVCQLGGNLLGNRSGEFHTENKAIFGTHRQLPLTANFHALQTLIPTLDDLTGTQTEVERRTAGVGVELLAIHELSDVSRDDDVKSILTAFTPAKDLPHTQSLALLCNGSITDLEVLNDQAAGQSLLLGALLLGLLVGLLLLLSGLSGVSLLFLRRLLGLLLGGVGSGSLLLGGRRSRSLRIGLLSLGLSLLVGSLLSGCRMFMISSTFIQLAALLTFRLLGLGILLDFLKSVASLLGHADILILAVLVERKVLLVACINV